MRRADMTPSSMSSRPSVLQADLIRRLLRWYRTHKRNLPWRRTRDAYRLFISELMLQQTQVDRVIPKYRDWLRRFPTWNAAANATSADLIRAWAGLGYNRRALYVRDAARVVTAHGVPRTEEAWRRLKGVGPYAAAALAMFVNRKPAVVIDTNIRRVAGRAFLGRPFPENRDDAGITRALRRSLPETGAFWDIPQAFMDLGSSVCTVRSPSCSICPLQGVCRSAPRFSGTKPPKKITGKTRESRHLDKRHPDRIYRGRILSWIREHGPTGLHDIGPNIDPDYRKRADHAWLSAMVERLAKDGLLYRAPRDMLSLPNS